MRFKTLIIIVIIVLVVFAMFVFGWLSFDRTDTEANIEIDTQEMKEDTGEAIESGKELIDDAEKGIDDAVSDDNASSSQPGPETDGVEQRSETDAASESTKND